MNEEKKRHECTTPLEVPVPRKMRSVVPVVMMMCFSGLILDSRAEKRREREGGREGRKEQRRPKEYAGGVSLLPSLH